MAIAPGAIAFVVYLACLSGYLPLGGDLALAARGIFGGPGDAPFVWGALLSFAWAVLPGTDAFRLGVVSALGGAVSVAAVSSAAFGFLSCARGIADADASANDSRYETLPCWAASLAGVGLLLSPEIFLAATHVGPFTVQLALAMLPFAVLANCGRVVRLQNRKYLIAVAGAVAGFAFWEGLSGKIVLPIVFMLVWLERVRGKTSLPEACAYCVAGVLFALLFVLGADFTVPAVPRVAKGTLAQFFVLSVLPTLILYRFVVARWLKRAFQQRYFAAAWCILILIAGIVVVRSYHFDYGRAANDFLDEALKRLEGRRWIVSDGSFDDILAFRMPKDVHLVSFRREFDREHARMISEWAARELPDIDDDLTMAALLGPTAFLKEWSRHGGMATNCLFLTRIEPMAIPDRSALRPCGCAWRSEAQPVEAAGANAEWRGLWARMKPLVKQDEPGERLLREWMAVQGNAIGCMLRKAERDAEAWEAFSLAFVEMDADNLSLLVNMTGLCRDGKTGDAKIGEQANEKIKTAMNFLQNGRQFRFRLAQGGRLGISKEQRAKLEKLIPERREKMWETPYGKSLREALTRLEKVGGLEGKARDAELEAVERLVTRSQGAVMGAEWVKSLVCGEVELARGQSRYKEAQRHFRALITAGEGEIRRAFDRLLAVDMALGNHRDLEDDALLVLRREASHPRANAVVGSVRLECGDYAMSVRFLKRAIANGVSTPAVRNDLALALSGLGEHEKAVAAATDLARDVPGNWHVLDTLSLVLDAAGRKSEAAEARSRAESCALENHELLVYRRMLADREPRKGWGGWW